MRMIKLNEIMRVSERLIDTISHSKWEFENIHYMLHSVILAFPLFVKG